MATLHIPPSLLPSLKCSFCKYYLSMSPIICLEEQGNGNKVACGRCFTKLEKDSGYQSIVYETLAELLIFPCSYDSDGCCEEVEWNKASDHENICKFRAFQCPTRFCDYNGNINQLKEHLDDIHKDMHVYENDTITLPNKRNVINKIITVGNNKQDKFVLVLLKSTQRNGIGLLTLEDESNLTFDITFKSTENDNCLILKNNKIYSYIRNISRRTLVTNIDFGLVQAALNSTNIVFTISVPNSAKLQEFPQTFQNTRNKKFFDEFKCPVCKENMTSPIFICQQGHSLCSKCKNVLLACIFCPAPIKNGRNFFLEKILQSLESPCFNQHYGCTFVGSVSELKNHEDECNYFGVTCPFEEARQCKWFGAMCHAYDHVVQKHTENTWMKPGDTLYRNLNSRVYVDVHVVKFDDKGFRLCFKHNNERGSLLVSVQQMDLKPNRKRQYLFILEFVDQTKMGRKMIINGECTEVVDLKKCFYGCLELPYYLLEPFLTEHNLLIFKFELKRIEPHK